MGLVWPTPGVIAGIPCNPIAWARSPSAKAHLGLAQEAFKDIRFAALPAPELLRAPPTQAALVLFTDEASTYPRLARADFGKGRLLHRRTGSKLVRDTWNPLYAIHHTEAMARDHMGRPHRESWLASKQRRYLDLCNRPFTELLRTPPKRVEESLRERACSGG